MRILVAVDIHDEPESVVQAAVAWARALQGTLDVAYASEWSTEGLPDPPEPHDQLDALRAEWQARAAADRARLQTVFEAVPGDVAGRARLVPGRAVDALPDAAVDYDLAVASTHDRHGLQRVFLGSVTARLLRRSPIPVLVLRLGDTRGLPPEGPLRVVCPVDRGELGALPWARRHLPGAHIEVVHAVPASGHSPLWRPAPGEPSDLESRRRAFVRRAQERMRARAVGSYPVAVVSSESSNPGDAIAAYAAVNDTSVVVMPTHGRTGLGRVLLGSVAERVAERSACPVIVVPWKLVAPPEAP